MNERKKKAIQYSLVMTAICCMVLVYLVTLFNQKEYADYGMEGNTGKQEETVRNSLKEFEEDFIGNATVSSSSVAVIDEVLPVQPDTNMVIIDPGHGGEDEGCERDGVLEKDINLQLALALQIKLKEMGYEVIMTRNDDTTLTLDERIEIANDSNADIFISIHQNAYEGEEASGVEIWCGSETDDAESRLAKLLHRYLLKKTESTDRGLQVTDELKVIRETKMPACLVETGFLSNDRERELLLDAQYQDKIVEGLVNGIDLYFHPRTMYLTFDDGPSPENTNTILDTLKQKDIKATFFLIGENVEKYPEVAKRIVEEGHTIGIHCYSHDYNIIYADAESYINDFEKAQDIVYQTTGVEAKIFRFPGGSINAYNEKVYEEIIEEMGERGYTYYDWNASLEDAVLKSEPEQLIHNAKESTLGRKRIIMLAHDTIDNTALCLGELIDELPEYKMEGLDETVEPIQF